MNKNNHSSKEVWGVEISDDKRLLHVTYHVFANSAARAEKKGLEIAKSDKEYEFKKPYCQKAYFEFYVY